MATAAHLITPDHHTPSDHREDDLSSAELEDLGRCVGNHALALLKVLAAVGDGWDASPQERRRLAELVGPSTASSPTSR